MYNRLYQYLQKDSILNNDQFGFRKGFSTEMALIVTIDKITKAIVDGNHVIGLFLDLQKAFDTVDPSMLLLKLERYTIGGNSLAWFRN